MKRVNSTASEPPTSNKVQRPSNPSWLPPPGVNFAALFEALKIGYQPMRFKLEGKHKGELTPEQQGACRQMVLSIWESEDKVVKENLLARRVANMQALLEIEPCAINFLVDSFAELEYETRISLALTAMRTNPNAVLTMRFDATFMQSLFSKALQNGIGWPLQAHKAHTKKLLQDPKTRELVWEACLNTKLGFMAHVTIPTWYKLMTNESQLRDHIAEMCAREIAMNMPGGKYTRLTNPPRWVRGHPVLVETIIGTCQCPAVELPFPALVILVSQGRYTNLGLESAPDSVLTTANLVSLAAIQEGRDARAFFLSVLSTRRNAPDFIPDVAVLFGIALRLTHLVSNADLGQIWRLFKSKRGSCLEPGMQALQQEKATRDIMVAGRPHICFAGGAQWRWLTCRTFSKLILWCRCVADDKGLRAVLQDIVFSTWEPVLSFSLKVSDDAAGVPENETDNALEKLATYFKEKGITEALTAEAVTQQRRLKCSQAILTGCMPYFKATLKKHMLDEVEAARSPA